MKGKKKINWDPILKLMPTSKTDPVAIKQRKKLFRDMDPNGNGFLSLAEIDKGILDLGLDGLFNCKPAIIKAFQHAKNYGGKDKKGTNKADYVERKEFRVFLLALRQYFEYYDVFDRVDTSDDGRITIDEFYDCWDVLERYVGPIKDLKAAFEEIDQNMGGFILFDEFA